MVTWIVFQQRYQFEVLSKNFLLQNVIQGYNGTVFAYGQTGSGKTYSMQGDENIPPQKGIIPRAFEHIFEATATTDNAKFLVHVSYLEVWFSSNYLFIFDVAFFFLTAKFYSDLRFVFRARCARQGCLDNSNRQKRNWISSRQPCSKHFCNNFMVHR